MASFDNYTNYKNNAGVSGVVFGADKTVLEVELNEMQEIEKFGLRNMIAKIAGDGITDRSKLTYENGIVKIASGCGLLVNGILVNCSGLSLTMSSGTAYLQVWEETVSYSDTLKEEGNQQNADTIANWAKDDRSDAETSRRKVVKYQLSTDVDSSKYNLEIASVTSDVMTKLVNEVNLTNLTSRVDDIQAYIGYTDPSIYGVEVDFKNNKFTRLANAIGKNGGTDFDDITPWDRKRCNVTDAGVVVAYYGDAGYTETGRLTQVITIGGKTYSVGTRVQVMVEQKKFYYRMVPLSLEPIVDGIGFKVRKARYYVSATPKAGFKLYPAFRRNGVEVDKVYDGAFEGSIFDKSTDKYCTDDSVTVDFTVGTGDKLASIANTRHTSGLTMTRANCRKLASNVGLGWQQEDFLIDNMTILLFMIEYAKLDAQSVIGMGVNEYDAAAVTGGTSSLGNGTGSATGTNGKVSVTYRGKENPYGNIYKWSDGANIEAKNKNILYYADHGFTDNTGASPYKSTGFSLTKTSGFISAFGWSEDCDFLFLPAESTGDSSKPVGDYTYVNPTYDGWRLAALGGGVYSYSNNGLCCWSLSGSETLSNPSYGCRLVYIPVAA